MGAAAHCRDQGCCGGDGIRDTGAGPAGRGVSGVRHIHGPPGGEGIGADERALCWSRVIDADWYPAARNCAQQEYETSRPIGPPVRLVRAACICVTSGIFAMRWEYSFHWRGTS